MKFLLISILLISVLLMMSCICAQDPELHYKHECSPEQNEQIAAWVLKCIEVANPKADEEPEDWIYQCKRTAKQTLCNMQPFLTYQPCLSCTWSTIPCADIQEAWLKKFCPK